MKGFPYNKYHILYFAGKIDPIATVTLLRSNNSISSNVILIFDEIYLQKCKEYIGGQTFGEDKDGNLYKGMMTFMIIGIGKNIHHVLHATPENRIDGSLLVEEILRCIHWLQLKGFNVRTCVCDNPPSNISAYRKLLSNFSRNNDDRLFM